MTDAIFKTTSQALHVAFLVCAEPPRQKGTSRDTFIRILEGLGELTPAQGRWLDQLRGQPSDSIDFSGLTSDEIRGECFLTVEAVTSLPAPEMFAIWARFAVPGIAYNKDRSGSTIFEELSRQSGMDVKNERAAGVTGVAQYIKPMLMISDNMAIQALVYGHVLPNQRERGLSFKDIERDRGINARTLRRAAAIVGAVARQLEDVGMARLTARFVRDGKVMQPDGEPYKKVA